MSKYGEPWVIGVWEQMYVDKKMYYEFREKPESIHSDQSIWTGVKYGDRIHCSDWGKPSKAIGEIVMGLAGEYSGTYLDCSEPNIKRIVACVNLLAHVPDGILANMPGKRYLLTFDTIEEAEKLVQMFKDHEEDQ